MNTIEKVKIKENPNKKSNIISKLFFGWTLKIFYKGNKKNFSVGDLYKLAKSNESKYLGDQLEKNWKNEIIKCKETGEKPNFRKVLTNTYFYNYMLIGIFIFVLECILRVLSPFALQRVIQYFKNGRSLNYSYEEVLYYATALNLITLVISFVFHHTQYAQRIMGMNVNRACSSLIYRKVLRLNASSLNQNAGQVVVLLSNDVSKFDEVFLNLHFLWILPVQLALISYLLWLNVQIASVIGILSLILQTLPIQGMLGNFISKLRSKTVLLTDIRVLFINEFISGIQTIKMYAWEVPFVKSILKARENEFKVLLNANYLKAINSSFINFTDRASLFITIFIYTYMGNVITADKAFAMMQFFKILQNTTAFKYPKAVVMGAEALISIKRIEKFLLLEEKKEYNYQKDSEDETKFLEKSLDLEKSFEKSSEKSSDITDNSIQISEKSLELLEQSLEKTLQGSENLSLRKVSTPARSRKSKFIHVNNVTACWFSDQPILKNITTKIHNGQLVIIVGAVGSGKSSFLQVLLSELSPKSGNVKISGAISYCSQEPWLFNGTIKNNILFGLSYDKQRYTDVIYACALYKDFIQFPNGDQTIVGDQGTSLSGGQKARINLARTIYRKSNIYLLDDPLSAVDTHVSKHLFQKCFEKYLKNKIRILVTHQVQFLKNADFIIVMNNGDIEFQGTYDELLNANVDFVKSLNVPTDENDIITNRKDSIISLDEDSPQDKTDVGNGNDEEKMETGQLNKEVYMAYLKSGGNWLKLFEIFAVLIFSQVIFNMNDYWLSYWTNTEQKRGNLETKFEIPLENTKRIDLILKDDALMSTDSIKLIYLSLIIAAIIGSILRALLMYNASLTSAKNLHSKMLISISEAPMRFFNKNPLGRILNRFSKDVGIIDDYLPTSIFDTVQVFLGVIGSLALIAYVNILTIIPIIITLLIFNQIRIYYLRTAQDVKRLEGITRSPVFSHLTSSISGLTTIRSCNAEKKLEDEFDNHQDLHTSAWYLTIVCSTSLGFWIDILYTIFLACVTYSFIFASQGDFTFTDSQLGLVLSQAIVMTHVIQRGVRLSAEMICQMTAVERVLQYMKGDKEGPFQTPPEKAPPSDWPRTGDIQFKNLSIRYDLDDQPILKNLDIDIEFKQKIGIVGRTGAGKSSLISSLFKLYFIEGDIIIDGINVNNIGLKDLRSHISIIPQQPILFTGTIRQNLDPFGEFNDEVLWNALEEVELKDSVPSLDIEVSSSGSSFSLGQKQMICLARAILRNNKILVLDEATANIDPQTDQLIQTTIKRKFCDCTVLTIAHRLHTIMESDKVLVMDNGIMVEFDHPFVLLQNHHSAFYRMVKLTGPLMARQLYEIARQSYEEKQNIIEISHL